MKRMAILALFFLLFTYVQALNGIIDIKAEPVDESTPLEVTVECKDPGTVSLEIYSEEDETTPVYSNPNLACGNTANASTLSPGIYKIKASLNATPCSPCVFYKYVNVSPIIALFVPENHSLLVFIIPLVVLAFIRFSKRSQSTHKAH
ncbi:MAG: hypothetical protein J7J87_02715 [Candidatus Diapherotrites archaeon]|nr:hypothetical protein [Candidatus Diapherotrites archaeon]